ncbi:GIY-YIG nuclease family protein [Microbacterium rhizomatis]|uniref:GIY-YIG nuclease family protein n=1 Tax=Microbacterium rhizomatis TaxID=1631477 RepID=A0A5J5J619_9MICO|nr:GIY-YIG nuclease family protein [Microbacterium rhizomatis]
MVGDGCLGPVPPDAPIALCEGHLALAAEWAGATAGVSDVLPAPCRLCGSRAGVRYPSGWLCAVCEWRHGDIVDGELPPPRIDVVYYLRFADRVKIGTTANPRQRFAAIRHDELLAFERGDRRQEHRRHLQFGAERYGTTEWFRLTDSLRAHIDLVRDGTGDPWERHARWVSEALALRG